MRFVFALVAVLFPLIASAATGLDKHFGTYEVISFKGFDPLSCKGKELEIHRHKIEAGDVVMAMQTVRSCERGYGIPLSYHLGKGETCEESENSSICISESVPSQEIQFVDRPDGTTELTIKSMTRKGNPLDVWTLRRKN